MHNHLKSCLLPAVLAFAAGTANAAPPFTVTSLAGSGDSIADVGIINSPFYNNNQVPACTGARGILKVAVNNSGQWLLQVDAPSLDTFTDGAMISSLFPPTFLGHTPYWIEGTEGYFTAPSGSTVAAPFGSATNFCSPANPFFAEDTVGAMAVSNSGVNAMMLRFLPGANADRVAAASSAIFFNTGAVVAQQGQPVNCAGLSAGTVWGALTSDTATMSVNAANQFLVIAPVIELGITKKAVIVISTDASGNVTGSQLIAKEGGLVGSGPATWTAISAGSNTCAINDAGSTIFSGRTSAAVSGLYMNGAFVALEGGPTPVADKNWGSLLGVPLDLNNHGDFVFRAFTANGSGIWTETSPDAGEETDGQNGIANVPGDSTFGNGPLTRILGSLSSDTDVDMYRIHIDDPAQFSASVVPDPGTGFPGAAFDSMMYLIREPGNGTGLVVRCNDVSPTVLQSAITGTYVPAAGDYYVVITTPKVRPLVNKLYYSAQVYRNDPAWIEDPGFIGVANGRAIWTDPSAGVIRKASTTTGAIDTPDIAVANPQSPSIPTGQSNLTGPMAVSFTSGIAKMYWSSLESGGTRIKRANFDGTASETIVTPGPVVFTSGTTGIAVDVASNKLFWSRGQFGEIWRTTPGPGGALELMLKIPDEIVAGFVNDNACERIAAGNGFVFWTNPIKHAIQRCSQNAPAGSSIEAVTTIVSNVNAEQIAVDTANSKIYWTDTANNVIKRANLNGSTVETFISTPRPVSISIDSGNVYWSNGDDRVIRRSPIVSPAATTLVNVGPDLGQTLQSEDSAGNGFNGWERVGTSVPGALPYQIRLTGASPRTPDAMIAKNNTIKVAGTNDPIPGRPNSKLTVVGSTLDAFKLSDRGDVLWRGSFYEPTVFINFFASALFFNNEPILIGGQIPPTFTDRLVFFFQGPSNVDFSKSGEWATVAANMQIPPFNFTFQPDRALLLHFDLPPQCRADFNADGDLNPDDLGDYITCYFTEPPCSGADFNTDNDINPDDLGDFITAYFQGC